MPPLKKGGDSFSTLCEYGTMQITDEQVAAFELKTDKLRMDSTIIASNIRETTRVQLSLDIGESAFETVQPVLDLPRGDIACKITPSCAC